jgi:hypothetical protein
LDRVIAVAQPKMPIIASRKKILDGGVFWVRDLFTECDNRVFRRMSVNIHAAPVTNWLSKLVSVLFVSWTSSGFLWLHLLLNLVQLY